MMVQQTMDINNKKLEYRMAKLDRLASIRAKYPNMSNDQIVLLFPELEEFIGVDTGGYHIAGI